MSPKSLFIIAITFIGLIIVAIFSFINPGAEKSDYDICDYNQDGIVETSEIWQCYQDGNAESTPLTPQTP